MNSAENPTTFKAPEITADTKLNALDPTIKDKGEKFVNNIAEAKKEVKEEKKLKEYIDAFTKHGDETLDAIKEYFKTNLVEGKTTTKEQITNISNANSAFKTDIANLNTDKKSGKFDKLLMLTTEIDYLVQIRNINNSQPVDKEFNTTEELKKIQKFADSNNISLIKINFTGVSVSTENLMTTKITETNKAETDEANKNSAIEILAKTTGDKLFTTGPESDFKTVMAFLCKNGGEKTFPSEKPTEQQRKNEENFLNLVKAVLPGVDIPSIKIGQASATFGDKFPADTWLIQYGTDKNGKEKYMSRGTDTHLQELIAQRADSDKKFDSNVFEKDKDGIYYFGDDNGNFEGFKTFIMKQDKTYMEQYLPTIVKQIKEYDKNIYIKDPSGTYVQDTTTNKYREIKKDEKVEDNQKYKQDKEHTSLDENFIKNGYADVLNDYMVAHPALMEAYIPFLTKENLNILGMDQKTRNVNYIKLINSRNSTGFRKELGKTPEGRATQKRLIDLQATILNQEPISIAEIASKGLDSLIKMFGSTFFNAISWLFGGKKGLLAAFPMLASQITEIYKKEYGLSKDQVTAIGNISGKFSPIQLPTIPKTGKEIEESFDKKTEYTALMMDEGTGYYKNINVNVFQKGLDLYDKDKKININDIVTITTDEKTQQQSITAIKDPIKFEGVMKSIIDNDATRTKIAAANDEVQKPGKVKDYNEQGIDITKNSYGINTQQDIARYLTASLFSNKDLSYVMTENELKGKEKIQTPKIYTVSYKEGANLRNIETPTTKDEKGLKSGDTITAVLNENGEEIRQSANNLKLKVTDIDAVKLDEAGLAEYYYKQVKTNDGKKRWIAENAITEKPEVIKTPEIADTRTEIKDKLGKASTVKSLFETTPSIAKEDSDIYLAEIKKISGLFTTETSYKKLIDEGGQTTLKSIVENNMGDLKNMFIYRSLKQTKDINDTIYGDKKITLNPEVTKNITEKQKYSVVKADKDGITINVVKNPNDANNTATAGSITLSKDATTGKLKTERKPTEAIASIK